MVIKMKKGERIIIAYIFALMVAISVPWIMAGLYAVITGDAGVFIIAVVATFITLILWPTYTTYE